jgi:hypothetical protein
MGKSYNLTSEELIRDMIPIVSSVDQIDTVHIAGGEPFLHKDLIQFISWLSVYPNVRRIEIVTNGTIIPDSITLDSLKVMKDRTITLVSDYSGAGVDNKELIALLEANAINHKVHKDMAWKDKSDTSYKGYRGSDLLEVAGKCKTFRQGYFSLINGIITAHCPTAGSLLYYHGLYKEMDGFFFSIRETETKEIPNELKRLNDIIYTPMCNYCVPTYIAEDCAAGEQMQ